MSYNPKRNQAAEGQLKITSVKTTEDVVDSNNFNLSGQQITWNDPSNPQWYEQFIKVMNALYPQMVFLVNVKKATQMVYPTNNIDLMVSNTDIQIFIPKTVEGQSLSF